MSLNKEIGPKSLIAKYHLVWVSFYLVLFAIVGVLVVGVYAENKENTLPSGHVELTLNKKKFQVGEEIQFTVTNKFPATVYVKNNCPTEPLEAYKWDNNKWIAIHDQVTTKSSLCYTQPRNIAVPANGSLTYSYSDWKSLFAKPGVYRVVMVIDHYKDLPFQDFVVMEPVPPAPEPVPPAPEPVPVVEPAPVIQTQPVQQQIQQQNVNYYYDDDDD